MRRRAFLVLGGAALAWPRPASAQTSMRRIGILSEDDRQALGRIAVFREELQKLGWREGVNIRIDTHWPTLHDARSRQAFAKDMVASRPDCILSLTTVNTAALLQQTRTIPIVFVQVADPIGSGFVETFARPGGNVTGFINFEPSMSGKWLELLKEVAPRLQRAAMLFNPATTPYADYYLASFKTAAAALGVEAAEEVVREPSELPAVIAAQAGARNGGLVVMPDTFMNARRNEIASLATHNRVPTIAPWRQFAEAGGLMSYGNESNDNYRRAAIYADRILKGEKPGELPVQAPVKFDLIINLKTAKILGLDVPFLLQQRADEVIE